MKNSKMPKGGGNPPATMGSPAAMPMNSTTSSAKQDALVNVKLGDPARGNHVNGDHSNKK